MEGRRVVSKNLFNFQPAGVVDADILAKEQEMFEMMGGESRSAMMDKMNKMSDEDFAVMLNGMMGGMADTYFKSSLFSEAEDKCDQSSLSVPTVHDGEHDVQVLVHSPKSLSSDVSRPCIIYAHGGGAIAGSAAIYKGFLSHMATDCGVVVFNVDYRLAPGTRCPNNILDFYAVIKYVHNNSGELCIDPSRIAIAGESGGGYVCAGAMVHLARQEEADMVKLAVPIIPMLTDYCFTDTDAMTKEEAEHANGQQKVWRLLAGPNIENMTNDPLLYPGKADEETLRKMPPTIVWDAEFDFFITEAVRFANRLRAAGRLLEVVVIPGAKHASGMSPMYQCFRLEREAWRIAIQEYLIK